MRLLHGDTGELDRPVARVCATDMPDPRPFVTPGALVCTGLVWRQQAADSDRYVGLLAGAGVVGVVAGQALHGHVPEDVVAACRRHRLPLLSVPQSVAFSRIIEYLAEQAAEMRWRRVQSRADSQRRLLTAVAAGAAIETLVADFAAEQHVSAWLLTATGTVIAGTADLVEADVDRILATALTAPRLPAVATGAMRVLQVGAGDRVTAWYLVIRPSAPERDPFGADLAAVAELYRQRRADRQHLDWELADRFPVPFTEQPSRLEAAIVCEVHATEAGTGIEPVPDALTHRPLPGGPPGSSERASAPAPGPESAAPNRVAGRVDSAAGLAAVRSALHDVLPDLVTSLDREGRVVGVTSGGQDEVATAIRRRLGRIMPVLTGIRLAIGVSARHPEETLAGAIAAAAAASTAARDDAAPLSLRAADIDSAVGLFTTVPGGLQRRFAERVLGPVLEYDRRHGAGLLETLAIFLGCEGSWRQAADRMHLHLNTVRYRIGRIEELTGRDLGRLDDRLDLYLAVRTLGGQTAPV
ncbi:PucR family transcriptional regulator [Nocardia sp. CT2-14]|uniref:PucR family transcriptional regulator n=2 Tax=Nocardia aurantiaca TaxID=2675850 RepID=A0A6I3KR38_9NOCA|nr:PucR family transcriptional regulator [Nocardia aurantiaca]